MKKNSRKLIASVISLVLLLGLLAGCGSSTTSAEDFKGETIYGQVTSVDDDSITIDIGTQKETQASDDAKSEDDESDDANSKDDESKDNGTDSEKSDSNNEKSASDNSFLDLTGESTVVEITDSTEITKESTGGGQGQGNPPGDKPDGDGNSNNGSAPGNSGNSDSDSQPPEKPEGDDNSDNDSAPSNNGGSDSGSQPPEKPEGDSSSDDSSNSDGGSSDGEEPSGDNDSDSNNGTPSSESEDIELSDIAEGDVVKVVYDDDGQVTSVTIVFSNNSSGGGPGESSNENIEYSAVNEYTEDTSLDGETVESEGKDENAILLSADDATLDLSNITVDRLSDSSTGGDNSSFYGVGAAILATAGKMTIKDATIDTDADGGAGVFAYGDSEITISDSTITTKQDTSGGIHVAGGGTINASNLDITTNGESSAAIRSDRGSGTINVDGGTYTSNGTGSPAIYSTADISVKNATLEATASEAICIEGLNSISLTDSDLTGNMRDDDQNDTTWNVILYQSQSGDSEEGNSTFQMDGGSLTAKNGGMFYTTNTESTITLSDVDITYADDSEFFLQATGNDNERGWGQTGSNGANSLFTAINQEMKGDVIWDSISELDFYMTDGSSLEGSFVQDETYAGDGGDGYAKVVIDEDSTWTVTADSTVSSIECEGKIVDSDGNTVTIKGTDGTTYVDGDSKYTVTTDSYSDTADLSGASSITDNTDNSATDVNDNTDNNSDSGSGIFARFWNFIKGIFK